MRGVRSMVAAALAALSLVVAGCSTGTDAAVYGGSFTFVSPGGKTEFGYPATDRQSIGAIAGPKLVGDGTLAVSDYPGSVVVLNFWGSWCAPCRAEASDLNAAAAGLSGDKVQFVGINVRDAQADGADFQSAKGVQYPSIFDPTMRTLLSIRGYPTNSIPSTIVLDRQHRVAHIWLGAVTRTQLASTVAAIAGES